MRTVMTHHRNVGGWLLMAIASVTIASGPAAAQSKVGTAAAQFLGIGIGSRAVAMGGAYVAMSNDVASSYWNPGAFVQAGKSQFTFMNTEWLVGSKFRWGGLMLNFDGENAVAVSLTQLDYGSEEVTTVQNPDGTGEQWSAQDMAISLSYARLLTDRFSIGGSVKFITQDIWNETASTFAVDLGLLFVTGFNDMRLGVSISNFGGNMKLDGRDLLQRVDIDPDNTGSNKTLVGTMKTDAWPLPLFFRVGLAMEVLETDGFKISVAADGVRPSDNKESINVGGEVSWNELLFARAGYRSLLRTDSQESLTLGGGLKYTFEGLGSLEVNYAFQDFGILGNLNTIEVGISF